MRVQLNLRTNILHTSAVVTGFHMLAEAGELILEINDIRRAAAEYAAPSSVNTVARDAFSAQYGASAPEDALIDAVVDGRRVVFDLSDGYRYNDSEAVMRCFSEADVIFKRSFSDKENAALDAPIRDRIRPLGMNYFVTYKGNPLTPADHGIHEMIKSAKLTNSYVSDFEAQPLCRKRRPRVLFLARLWDPDGSDISGDAVLAEERRYINRMRTDTVCILRERFGGSFFGGIYRDGFSERYCPELLVGKAVTLKRSYLHRMRRSDICINTMGLHGSIGWKTAEYVAAARAIVSEEFVYSVPGGFDDGVNYLSFRSPEECAERVEMLMEDEKARLEMSRANRDYYENSLRPDAQIRQALRQL